MHPQETLWMGWREWVSLPSINVSAIKAKIDTGARTSSLHAEKIKVIKKDGKKYVRFVTHPIQKNRDFKIECTAPLVDRRLVSDSGGHIEKRYIITLPINVGGHTWDAEFSLTTRKKMRFRLLLGRTAVHNCHIAPGSSYINGRVTRKKLAKVYDL